jgi:hypothetical protein
VHSAIEIDSSIHPILSHASNHSCDAIYGLRRKFSWFALRQKTLPFSASRYAKYTKDLSKPNEGEVDRPVDDNNQVVWARRWKRGVARPWLDRSDTDVPQQQGSAKQTVLRDQRPPNTGSVETMCDNCLD